MRTHFISLAFLLCLAANASAQTITGNLSLLAGQKIGIWTAYHDNGQVKSTGAYARKEKAGKWQQWKPDGMPDGEQIFP